MAALRGPGDCRDPFVSPGRGEPIVYSLQLRRYRRVPTTDPGAADVPLHVPSYFFSVLGAVNVPLCLSSLRLKRCRRVPLPGCGCSTVCAPANPVPAEVLSCHFPQHLDVQVPIVSPSCPSDRACGSPTTSPCLAAEVPPCPLQPGLIPSQPPHTGTVTTPSKQLFFTRVPMGK